MVGRIEACADLVNAAFVGQAFSLLDVGCRDKALKGRLVGCRQYQGVDLVAADEVVAHDLERPLPFEDRSFDVVAALDVIEHIDKAQQLAREVVRVARRKVFISLPNLAYVRLRARFMLGRQIGGKYSFPASDVKDRHRWLPIYSNIETFARDLTGGAEYRIMPLHEFVPGHPLFAMARMLARQRPNLFAYGALIEMSVA